MKKMYALLSPRARRGAFVVMTMFLLVAVFEVLGVTSVLPFMALATDPTIVERNHVLKDIYHYLQFTTTRDFVCFAGCTVIACLGFSNFLSAATTYVSLRYIAWVQEDLASQLLRGYLSRTYSWFLGQNTSALGRTILSEVGSVIMGYMLSWMRLASRIVVIVLIVSMLTYLNPLVAFITSSTLGLTYVFIYFRLRHRLRELGSLRVQADGLKYKVAREALDGIKTTIVFGRESFFLKSFSECTLRSAELSASQQILGELPRCGLEFLAFGGVIGIVLFLFYQSGEVLTAIPVLSVYTFAAYRLMPALQQSFSYVTTIRAHSGPLDHVYEHYFEQMDEEREWRTVEAVPLSIQESLHLSDVCYTYPSSSKKTLENIDIVINKNTTVALVGSTGAGKTTLVDIVLGLLKPSSGCLVIDDVALTKDNLANWQRSIGYVPQDIYLTDDTVTANIAFAIPSRLIDHSAVEKAACIANLHDFVSGLPDGYSTIVGDRGVRLSGGQRQRIGIARALYGDPSVLVLDEATSSLDGITEAAVMEAVDKLSSKKTIIIIAHRLSTVKCCDKIFVLESGKVTNQGTYEELMRDSPVFRLMAQHSAPPSENGIATDSIAIEVAPGKSAQEI